ncbi:copper transporter [Pisolithus marmoratus]|nr:copper transporter [Pisolithus marmoratus]
MNHGDHEGHQMPAKCAMNMLWNTQIINTCVVFRSWHIRTHTQFVASIIAILLLGVLYEYLRFVQQSVNRRIVARLGKGKRAASPISASGRNTPEGGTASEVVGLLNGRRARNADGATLPTHLRLLRAALYGASVFLSFFLMLVFMTYNAYLIFAVVAGAAIGHYIFDKYVEFDNTGGKSMACH